MPRYRNHHAPAQQILAPFNRFVTVAALVPLANAIRGHKVQPIKARMRRLAGEHLNEITVLQRCRKGKPIIDANAMAVVAHLGVDAIGEINGELPSATPSTSPFGVNTNTSSSKGLP